MPEYILYDKKGKKHILNHMIDVRTAMATGLYSAERPEQKIQPKPKKAKFSDIKEVKTEKTPMEKMKEEVKTKTEIDKMEEIAKEKK